MAQEFYVGIRYDGGTVALQLEDGQVRILPTMFSQNGEGIVGVFSPGPCGFHLVIRTQGGDWHSR